jgi:hypothetical protein
MSRGRITDERNTAVDSNEISDINFELRITPVRLQGTKWAALFYSREIVSDPSCGQSSQNTDILKLRKFSDHPGFWFQCHFSLSEQ